MTTSIEALSGTWSSNWGDVTFKVSGKAFSGSWNTGSFKGTIEGDDLVMDWTHADGTTGKAKLSANADRNALKGTWGFDKTSGEGEWELSQTDRQWAPPKEEPKAEEPKAEEPKAAKAQGKSKAKAKA